MEWTYINNDEVDTTYLFEVQGIRVSSSIAPRFTGLKDMARSIIEQAFRQISTPPLWVTESYCRLKRAITVTITTETDNIEIQFFIHANHFSVGIKPTIVIK